MMFLHEFNSLKFHFLINHFFIIFSNWSSPKSLKRSNSAVSLQDFCFFRILSSHDILVLLSRIGPTYSMNWSNLSFLFSAMALNVIKHLFLLTYPRFAPICPYTGCFYLWVAPCWTISASFCLYFAMLFWAFIIFSSRFNCSLVFLLFCFWLEVLLFLSYMGFLKKSFLFLIFGMASVFTSLLFPIGELLFSMILRDFWFEKVLKTLSKFSTFSEPLPR